MKSKTLPFNLQYFAQSSEDGGGDDSGSGMAGDGAGTGGDTGAGDDAGDDSGTTEPTFDDLLKGGHQAEFDRRVQKAINTAMTKAQEKWQALTDDKLSEAEKLARMSKEEKEDYLSQKHEKELAEREAAITRRELAAEAKNTLAEKKLPVELAEILNYADVDTCKASIEAVEKAFQKAVEADVEEKLKGGKPPKKAPESGAVFTKDQVNAMSPEEINKNWDSISESMKTWK